ncbi:MAG: hypothetical protein U5N86_08155 [Planctomycetota bacterium]|nr:hypothetical protein [Planctomycetota bacterium]
MDDRYYPEETNIAEEFMAKDKGFAQTLQGFVESAPWIVASLVLHLVIFAGLALVSMGGTEQIKSVDITSDFERSETPTPTVEETTPPPEEEVEPIEEEEELRGRRVRGGDRGGGDRG